MDIFTSSLGSASALLLILTVAAIGVLHTIVPDHWVPITLIARDRKWTKGQTARAAFIAGTGHVVTTLMLGLIVWIAGVVVAARFGHVIDLLSSTALIAFGLWVGISAWREIHGHGHTHTHADGEVHEDHDHNHGSKKTRTALLLILGSSPMIEGIPAFFAAGKYGIGVIIVMSIVFAISTIATYVLLCVYSAVGLEQMKLGAFEKYGEVLSGVFITIVGLVFLVFPVL